MDTATTAGPLRCTPRAGGCDGAPADAPCWAESHKVNANLLSLENAAKTLRNGNCRGDPANAPRCRAVSKRTGLPCRQPAIRGRPVCRLHGGKGGAPPGSRNGSWRHGGRSLELRALLDEAKAARHALVRETQLLLAELRATAASRCGREQPTLDCTAQQHEPASVTAHAGATEGQLVDRRPGGDDEHDRVQRAATQRHMSFMRIGRARGPPDASIAIRTAPTSVLAPQLRRIVWTGCGGDS
jgi:hypothetical protein